MRPTVVMGVSGSGKSSVGAALAQRVDVPFADGDEFHTDVNIAQMAAGIPLDDDDRYPWLEAVGEWLSQHPDGGVITCSALKRSYRDQLRRHCPGVEFLYLSGSPDLIGRRLADRTGHFMPAALLQSQFEALEPLGSDERGLTVDITHDIDAIVGGYLAQPPPALSQLLTTWVPPAHSSCLPCLVGLPLIVAAITM